MRVKAACNETDHSFLIRRARVVLARRRFVGWALPTITGGWFAARLVRCAVSAQRGCVRYVHCGSEAHGLAWWAVPPYGNFTLLGSFFQPYFSANSFGREQFLPGGGLRDLHKLLLALPRCAVVAPPD